MNPNLTTGDYADLDFDSMVREQWSSKLFQEGGTESTATVSQFDLHFPPRTFS